MPRPCAGVAHAGCLPSAGTSSVGDAPALCLILPHNSGSAYMPRTCGNSDRTTTVCHKSLKRKSFLHELLLRPLSYMDDEALCRGCSRWPLPRSAQRGRGCPGLAPGSLTLASTSWPEGETSVSPGHPRKSERAGVEASVTVLSERKAHGVCFTSCL